MEINEIIVKLVGINFEKSLVFVLLDRYRSQYGVGVGMYQYIHDDDENTFQLVDSTRLPKPAYQKRPRFQQNVKEEMIKELNFVSFV
jgi:hypothetical protein